MRLPDARIFDPPVECFNASSRRERQTSALRAELIRVTGASAFYGKKLGLHRALDAGDLASLPFTTRAELVSDQAAAPPFGTISAVPATEAVVAGRSGVGFSVSGHRLNLFATADDVRRQATLVGRALWEAGVRPGDRVYVADDPRYNLVAVSVLRAVCALGAIDVYVAAERSGRTARYVVPVLPPAHVFLSPTYAGYLPSVLAGAAGARWPIRSIAGWGEPGYGIAETRARLRALWDAVSVCPPVAIVDVYALSETGVVAFGCREGEGLHVLEDAVVVEIVEPGGDRVVAAGDRGEIVVTRLGASALPLVRYRTGDAAVLDDAPCACGRTGRRLFGIERLAERVSVRGHSVGALDVERALAAAGARPDNFMLVRGDDETLHVRLAAPHGVGAPGSLAAALGRALGVPVSIDMVGADRLPPFIHKTLRVVDAGREGFLAEELRFQQELERV
jgi:phenylacetate-CoA ligase